MHSAYLCFKVLATFGAITMCGSHKKARNIERGFALGHKNVHFLREGDGDICWYHLKRKTLAANHTKAISQTDNHKLLAH
jgi:hypothetical protein